MRRYRLWIVSLVAGLVGLTVGAIWAGTGGVQAFLDSTGRLIPVLTGVPLILSSDTSQPIQLTPGNDGSIQLTTTGVGQILANGVSLPQIDSTGTLRFQATSESTAVKICDDFLSCANAHLLWVDPVIGPKQKGRCDGGDCPDVTELEAGMYFSIARAGGGAEGLRVNESEIETTDLLCRTTDPTTPAANHLKTYCKQGTPDALFVRNEAGTVTQLGAATTYTNEEAQDAVGAMVDASLTYVDATPLLQRAALTGDVTATAGSNATVLATKFRTLKKSISLLAPTTAETNKIQWEWPSAVTMTEVSCSTDVGTVTIQLIERARATPNSGGTDSMTADLVCSTTTATTTSFADSGIAANVPHSLEIVAVATAPTVVRIHLTATVN